MPGRRFAGNYAALSGAAAAAFDPASIFTAGRDGGAWDFGNTAKLFQSNAGTTAVAAAGDPVGYVQDLSGKGRHLKCLYDQPAVSDGSARPIYQQRSGFGCIVFDGVDDLLSMRSAFGSTLPLSHTTGWTRIFALESITFATADQKTLLAGSGTFTNGRLIHSNTTGTDLRVTEANADLVSGAGAGVKLVVAEVYNGASSFVSKNGGAQTTFTTANDSDGLLLAHTVSGNYGNAAMYRGLLVNAPLSGTELANVITWAGAAIGLAI